MSTRLEAEQAASGPDAGAASQLGRAVRPVGQPRLLIARTARALGLDPRQAKRLRRALREERLRRQAVRERLAECRDRLRAALSSPEPDPRELWELAREERVLLERERSWGPELAPVLTAILSEEQVRRFRRRSRG
jgi:hypothetical protein